MRRVLPCLLLASAGDARADGLYFTEAVGVGIGKGDIASYVGQPMHMRVAVGARLGSFAIEPWVTSRLQLEREGAWRGVVGGEPARGTADVAAWGVDAKWIFPVAPPLEAYIRGGPAFASTTGALAGYEGRGFGVSYGMQLSGKVRALGFLWTPLFFLKKGPLITGALYLDTGYDFFQLRMPGAPTLDARIGHVSVGFALGQAF